MKKYSILYQIGSLQKLVLRHFIHYKNLDEYCNIQEITPTPTQMEIIEYILDNKDKEIYQKDLENILNLRRATVSGVLQTMEKNKLIERITDKDDTRTKKITLTNCTKDIFSKHNKRMVELEKVVIKNISSNDLDIFYKVIEQMKENINVHYS